MSDGSDRGEWELFIASLKKIGIKTNVLLNTYISKEHDVVIRTNI